LANLLVSAASKNQKDTALKAVFLIRFFIFAHLLTIACLFDLLAILLQMYSGELSFFINKTSCNTISTNLKKTVNP